MERKATDIFSEWAEIGKDAGMETNHARAVDKMLFHLVNSRTSPFSFIDAGCGNGWVVRKIRKHDLCENAIGVDGAVEMIRKAKKIDEHGDYFHSDLMEWIPDQKVDFVHSMEVIYYFKQPEKLIFHIIKNWLRSGGVIIMGMDYYDENLKCHSWPTDLNTCMKLLSKNAWVDLFNDCGLTKVNAFQTNASYDFPGTLVLTGIKR